MVIFHGYVKLPDGTTFVHGTAENIGFLHGPCQKYVP